MPQYNIKDETRESLEKETDNNIESFIWRASNDLVLLHWNFSLLSIVYNNFYFMSR